MNQRYIELWYALISGLVGGIINLILYLTPSIPSWIAFWVFVGWIVLMAILLSILYMNYKNQNKLRFGIIRRFKQSVKADDKVNEPIDSEYSIFVHTPNRPAKRCNILLNDKRLPWADNDKELYYRDIGLGGGGNARIPKNEFPEDIIWKARGKIMEDNKICEEFVFFYLPISFR